jgi:hypothetical protein
MRAFLISLPLILLLAANLPAAREIEPNNHWLQGTLIDGTEPVEGALNDEQDVYKLLLPETGEVTVTLDSYPEGANLTLDVLGFRKDPIVPINKVKSHGQGSLKAIFNAQDRIGYLAISVAPLEKVCKDQWCIMRLVVDGPYYLLQSGPTLPSSWNQQPIIDPPEYRLTIVHPKILRERQQVEKSRRAVANLPQFKEDRYGLQFRYRPDWNAQAVSEQKIVIKPMRTAADDVQVVIDIRDKKDFLGSSSKLQLNLAEKTLLDASADIVKRGEMQVMQRTAPYLLATYPDPVKGKPLAHLQLIIDDADQYYWVSYSAPAERYPDFTAGFATILKTFEINTPDMQPASGSLQ